MTIEIPLSKRGKKHAGKYVAVVDDCDKDLAELNWSVSVCKRYAHKTGQQSLHRAVLSRKLERPLSPLEFVDHINGNSMDNRRDNLRVCTATENARNKRKHRNNTSGFKGVSYNKRDRKYSAHIMVDKKSHCLGDYRTAEEAYKAYCEAAIKYHGEFARLD